MGTDRNISEFIVNQLELSSNSSSVTGCSGEFHFEDKGTMFKYP